MENVPGLLSNRGGKDFRDVLSALNQKGLVHITWRTINSAELGLPHYRERIFIVASREKQIALSLHAGKISHKGRSSEAECPEVLGFYWTGGARSLCIKKNAVPALKVGAPSEKGGTSPVAVFYGTTVRKLTPAEAIRLQGFDPTLVEGMMYGDVLRMAGDAVSRPVGAFVVDSVFSGAAQDNIDLRPAPMERIPDHGYLHAGKLWMVRHHRLFKHAHVWGFLDHLATGELSPQASAGLCCRIMRARAEVPSALFEALYQKSKTRTKLLGTKVNSFEILHEQMDPASYLEMLRGIRRGSQIDLFAE